MEVYLTRICEFEPFLNTCADLLPENRKERIKRFKSKDDKLRSFCAGLLIRKFVNGNISALDSGKPVTDSGVFFNVSHSGEFAAFARYDAPIGIDIEKSRQLPYDIGGKILSDDEKRILASPDNQTLLKLWTRKESVMKASGKGLSMSANSFTVLPFEKDVFNCGGKEYSILTEILDGYYFSAACETRINSLEFIILNPNEVL